MCLKSTVQYYTSRDTPVSACFLDLSKAFDLVSYDILWQKLTNETSVPEDLIEILKFWYGNQINSVRWAGVHSGEYRLECGVRQGGLSSPRLFNLYVNQLMDELNNAYVGCSVDGKSINNISYADDMVLLSPSMSALQELLDICDRYSVRHGLRYNGKKSEVLVFKAGRKSYKTVPPVTLGGEPLRVTKTFKYLGHWVTEDLKDDLDIERERRALAVRGNMLARRFARCNKDVKKTLFKAFCQSFYTCSLWASYTQRAYNALRIQYNNVFRMLMGLPRHCSASGMFAEAHTDDFFAIIRNRSASLMQRLCGSTNSILKTLAGKIDAPLLMHWNGLHVEATDAEKWCI
ncbi:uncharacterized protein LOC133525883 [Cydia pomonella]|uniref:uncharacterized protein LOC133525883 n=1 Tax=Cydia pomonella TaxID=82600 RepID=UPI002ADD9263|nr:uncharacterized protein LOC133525883 [Cydia pomonella]